MPPDLALLSTLIGSNYPCLELIFMVPMVFKPLKFDCMQLCLELWLCKKNETTLFLLTNIQKYKFNSFSFFCWGCSWKMLKFYLTDWLAFSCFAFTETIAWYLLWFQIVINPYC